MIASTSLEGTVAVVTGAARGIGRAIALELAAAGADVGVGLRDVDRDGGVVAEIEALGRRAVALPMDVTDLARSRCSAASTCSSTTPAAASAAPPST
jgi:NAD(P)-dependent dehydrogenase (short-subunit alcohol dehydrogenase family)